VSTMLRNSLLRPLRAEFWSRTMRTSSGCMLKDWHIPASPIVSCGLEKCSGV